MARKPPSSITRKTPYKPRGGRTKLSLLGFRIPNPEYKRGKYSRRKKARRKH